MNTFLTILAGVFVFSLSQYFLKLILEPIIQFRKILSEISNKLLSHQKAILGGNTNEDIHNEIAELSAKLRSSTYLIPFYSFLYRIKIFGLPKTNNILLACRKLNQLTYGVLEGIEERTEKAINNENILKDIAKLLPIETTFMIDNE
ncbi:hypothetical protein KQH27_00620 [bacterium]|nr:hypothetical protein [bacterium]